jgi:hypothetical protein
MVHVLLRRIRERSGLRYDVEAQRLGYGGHVRYQLCLKDKNGQVLRKIGRISIGSSQIYDCLKVLEDHLIAVSDIAMEETELIQSTISKAKEPSLRAYQ